MKKLLVLIAVVFLFTSCVEEVIPVSNYYNETAIVHNKTEFGGNYKFQIEKYREDYDATKIYWIHVTSYDYGRYEVGDTIRPK